jgi:NitT/TauT family transport system ATP-binding protein/sulfonate transport system ATP-binding protein
MLLVTHDTDEAIYMSDRIINHVPAPRPRRTHHRDRPRASRERNHPDFLRIRSDILEFVHFAGNPSGKVATPV